MISGVNYIKKGVREILFPHVCEICGKQLTEAYSFVCETCLNSRFERAGDIQYEVSSQLIIPESIEFIFSMWKFDKGGYLQDLLHNLKYHHLSGVGEDLGKQLGKELVQKKPSLNNEDILLVPVPLHQRKEKLRGFNQARLIAKGVKKSTGLELIPKGSVTRIKNTKTQTGFSLKKRNENIQNAFLITDPGVVNKKTCLIIDDVFTTGATTYELSKTLKKAGSGKILIATVACA